MGSIKLLNLAGITIILINFSSLIKCRRNPINFDDPPMWIRPCAVVIANLSLPFTGKISYAVERNGYIKIKYETERALKRFREVTDLWVKFSFHDYPAFKINLWWRVYIPSNYLPTFQMTSKVVGGPTPKFNISHRNPFLKNVYNWLQRVALGMEQLVSDQFVYNEPLFDKFFMSYNDLQVVLCVIDGFMYNFNIKKDPDITRDLMTREERDIAEHKLRLPRDLTIVREYINIMEYLVVNMRRFIENMFYLIRTFGDQGLPPRSGY